MKNIFNLDYFWKRVEFALSYLDKNDNQMTQLLENCLSELALQENLCKNSDYHHLKGYIYYSMRPQKLNNAREEFEKALELDSSNSHSMLYLGHTLYDLGHYRHALKQFQDIPKNSLPDWLMMKTDEMIVCCIMFLSPSESEKYIQTFLSKYAPIDFLDDFPFELSKLLEQKGRSLKNEAEMTTNNL